MQIRKIKLSGSGFSGETAYRVTQLVTTRDRKTDKETTREVTVARVGRADYITSICENAAYDGGTRLFCTCEDSWDGSFCVHLEAVAEYQESEAIEAAERQAKNAALISRIAPDYRGTDIERAIALHRQTLKEKVNVHTLTVAQLRRVIVRNRIGGTWTQTATKTDLQNVLIQRGYAAA